MNTHSYIGALACTALVIVTGSRIFAMDSISSDAMPRIIVSTDTEGIAPGKFQPTWKSLEQYQTPQWFRDAKFGIWANWGPQCEPERGDWYARNMYIQGNRQYQD